MTSDEQLDRRQLEAATSRSLAAGAALDSETLARREGFMILGRAAEAAGADYDEAALIARVQLACAGEPLPVVSRREPRRWSFWLGGVLAASVLIAVVRIAASWPDVGDPVALGPKPEAPTQVAHDEPQPLAGDVASPAWDDPLDEEIAAAESGLAELSGRLKGIDGALSDMNQTLEALSDDLSGGSL